MKLIGLLCHLKLRVKCSTIALETMQRLMWCLELNHGGMKALFIIKVNNEESDISFPAYCLELIPLEDKPALRHKALFHPTI